MRIFGLILAGGQSRRMGGGDKAAMLLDGKPLRDHALERLAPQVERVGYNAPDMPDGMVVDHVPDSVPDHAGPLAGVLAGMRWAAGHGASHIATAATDTPFAPLDFVARLAEADGTIAMAESSGRIHPVFALWPVNLDDELEHSLVVEDQRKIIVFAERFGLSRVVFSADGGDPFFNINTPDDLARAAEWSA